MKRCVPLVFSLILIINVQFRSLLAQESRWHTFGPIGGPVNVLAIDPRNPNILYAANWGALFKSTDNGANWHVLSSGDAPGSVYSIAFDPNSSQILYAASGLDVFKSTDGGSSWTLLKVGASWIEQGYWTLATDPKNSGVVYAGSADFDNGSGALLKSIDGGVTWRRVPLTETSWGSIYILSVNVDPSNSDIVYAASYQNLYQSMDGGTTWTTIANDVFAGYRSLLAIDPRNPDTLYLGAQGGVFKSTDRGKTWSNTSILQAQNVSRMKIHPRDSSTLYVSTYAPEGEKTFRSKDGGSTWTAISGSFPEVNPAAWDPQNPEIIYHTGVEGLFKSTDGGTSWRRLYSGLATLPVGALAVDAGNPSTAYALHPLQMFKTNDGGRRWTTTYSTTRANAFTSAIAIDPQNSNTIYAGTTVGVVKSTDSGVTWRPATTGLPLTAIAELAIDPQEPNTVYASVGAGFSNSLFKSTNGGANWSRISFGATPVQRIVAFAVSPHNSQHLYLVNFDTSLASIGPLYKSSDGGSTWNAVTFPKFIVSTATLAFDPQDPDRVYAVVNCNRIFTSTNAGVSFAETSTGTTACVRTLVVDPQRSNVMFAATDRGLIQSTDGERNWIFESGVPHGIVWDLAVTNGNKMYAALDSSGVFTTFNSIEAMPVPTLTLDSAQYCVGQPWALKVNGAKADTTIRLMGASNSQTWEIAAWNKTDASGTYEERGTFPNETEGPHMLYVEVDGVGSNDITFRVANCSPLQ